MFHSIYARMLATYIMITAFIILLQAVLLIQLFKSNYIDNTMADTVKIAGEISHEISKIDDIGSLSVSNIVDMLVDYDDSDYSIWLVNSDGVILDISKSENLYYNSNAISDNLDDIFSGEIVEFQDQFNKTVYPTTLSVAVPIYSDSKVAYALFVHTIVDTSQGVNTAVYRHLAISSIVSAFICVVLVSISSRHLTFPINQLSKMCDGISTGNYTTQIQTEGDDEISHLARSFNEMALQLKRHEELRVDFVANVSHELRSPITSIHGFAQGMYDGTIEPDEYKKYSGIIIDETARLKKLISELLDLSQIESGEFPLHFKEYDINEQIRRVIIKFLDRMEEKGINIHVNFEYEYNKVFADADRIDQTLVNLVDNAIKFTPKGGTITIWTKKQDEKILVGVSDTGAGISDEDLDNVFERFYKTDKAHSDKIGTGLGLSIVKKMLVQHGEKIWVTSELGKGTEFVFTLTSVVIE